MRYIEKLYSILDKIQINLDKFETIYLIKTLKIL